MIKRLPHQQTKQCRAIIQVLKCKIQGVYFNFR